MARLANGDRLKKLNSRLKGLPVSVLIRGDKFTLRATLPPRPGSKNPNRRQQEISIGVPVSEDGWRRIEAEAHKLSHLLIMDKFDWGLYIQSKAGQSGTIGAWVEEFKKHHLSTSDCSPETWAAHWGRCLGELPQDEPLRPDLLIAVVLACPDGSWKRKRWAGMVQRFVDFCGLQINVKQFAGGYRNPEPREIPSDEVIEELFWSIPNLEWQRVYGIMACFGVRTHEAFLSHLIDPSTLQVREGKTGARVVRAVPPEWAEKWGLDGPIPAIHWKEYRDISDRVRTAFSRYQIPFEPYALRHAYAIRCTVSYGFPVPVSAAWMGHDPGVHLKTYNRWLKASHADRVYRERMGG